MIVQAFGVLALAAGLHAAIPGQQQGARSAKQTPSSTAPSECERKAFECGLLLVEKGQWDAAIAALERALARTPQDLKARNLLGIALTGATRIEEANARFREALARDPDFNPARKNLAVNEFNAGRLDAAERLFRDVLGQLPDDEVAHVHLGEIHYARKQPELALPHYEKGGGRTMNNTVWTLHYGSSLLAQGQVTRAVEVLDRLPADDALTRFEAGVALGRAGAHADAARHFGAARTGYKDPYAAGYNQVLMLVEAGDHAGALRIADEMFRAGQTTGELYNLVSRAHVASNRIQEAYDALRAAARLEPSEEQHYLDLALLCLDHENFDLGMEIIEIGLQNKPAAPRLHLYRGVLFVMKGLVEQAEAEFEQARTLGPEGPAPYVALAIAWMQSGHTAKAVALLREKVKKGSRDAIVPYMLGIAIMRSGVSPSDADAAEAVQAFEHAIRLDPTLSGPHAELGKILLGRGNAAAAMGHLERAVSIDPDNAAPIYLLAQAYRRTGNTDRARELLARVTTLNAQERGDDPDKELKRIVVRIVREGAAPTAR